MYTLKNRLWMNFKKFCSKINFFFLFHTDFYRYPCIWLLLKIQKTLKYTNKMIIKCLPSCSVALSPSLPLSPDTHLHTYSRMLNWNKRYQIQNWIIRHQDANFKRITQELHIKHLAPFPDSTKQAREICEEDFFGANSSDKRSQWVKIYASWPDPHFSSAFRSVKDPQLVLIHN